MVVLKGKTIILKTLRAEDIEQIRNIRNSSEISKYFLYRKYITKQEQKSWFQRISMSENDFYFSIYIKDKLIGLTEIKKINWDLKIGEGGIFIIPEYQNSFNSFETSILMLDYAFDRLKLNTMKARVIRSNIRAIKYNKVFGFKEYNNYEQIIYNKKEEIILLKLTYNDYLESRESIAKLIGLK
jgi:RimJ/RimL family protein N-acetyltransferase